MSNWKYSHPEGVLLGLTGHDWAMWPLKRYADCLESSDRLDYCLGEAWRDINAKRGPQGQRGMALGACEGEEKYALRLHGLQLLREVQDGV
jgi:hypothetical protein